MNKNELKEGEIYKVKLKNSNGVTYVMKATKNLKNVKNIPSYNKFMKEGDFNNPNNQFFEATPKEKHWLEVYIATDKFITFDETMKTFIPEYVECILNQSFSDYELGKIYKVNKTSQNINKIESHNNQELAFYQMNKHRFKPSTKEAYDAQFVVKEPEFVLPEKWFIKTNLDNLPIISNWFKENKQNHINDYDSFRKDGITPVYQQLCFPGIPQFDVKYHGLSNLNNDYIEITFEQFKKYILKEGLEEPKDKVLNLNTLKQIQKVESSEGAIFQLNDKITVFTKDSPNKGRILNIKGFRWNNTKTNICAITEVHAKNGIGLDKIELYSEPKQIIKDFKLPETWWITIENKRQLEIAKQYFSQHFNNLNVFRIGKTVGYVKNVLDNYSANAFNLLTTTKMNNPQITFEQFEQYVLHNRFKIGDKFTKQKYLHNGGIIELTEKEIIDLQYINNQSIAFFKYTSNNYSGPECRILTKNIVK